MHESKTLLRNTTACSLLTTGLTWAHARTHTVTNPLTNLKRLKWNVTGSFAPNSTTREQARMKGTATLRVTYPRQVTLFVDLRLNVTDPCISSCTANHAAKDQHRDLNCLLTWHSKDKEPAFQSYTEQAELWQVAHLAINSGLFPLSRSPAAG